METYLFTEETVILVNDEDAINMSKKLAKELGLGVGISSGANLIASILLKGDKKKISSHVRLFHIIFQLWKCIIAFQ